MVTNTYINQIAELESLLKKSNTSQDKTQYYEERMKQLEEKKNREIAEEKAISAELKTQIQEYKDIVSEYQKNIWL
jgi:hypothetical protein